MAGALNVLGTPITGCSTAPLTGFFRDGCCNTDESDRGLHVVCTRVTTEFLEFSAAAGNDLSTPSPQYGFAGLDAGDQWCLCAARWLEAYEAGVAPPVVLEATHERALTVVTIEQLLEHAVAVSV